MLWFARDKDAENKDGVWTDSIRGAVDLDELHREVLVCLRAVCPPSGVMG